MEIVSVKNQKALEKAIKFVKNGGLVVFPTDTAYGLGADATSNDAVRKVYELKGRPLDKPIHVVVSDIHMTNDYVVVNKQAQKLAEAFLPGPLTLVLENKGRVSNEIVAKENTLGIRIPNNTFALELSKNSQVPITATSANKSGDPATYSISEVQNSFGSDFQSIDLVIDAGELKQTQPSTLVDLTTEEPKILREGPISREEILKVLS